MEKIFSWIFNGFQKEKWVVGATHKLWFCSFFKTQENAFLMIISLLVLCIRPSSLIPQLSAYGRGVDPYFSPVFLAGLTGHKVPFYVEIDGRNAR